MLGSVRQVNWKRIAGVHIKLFVIPLKNVDKRSVHNSAEENVVWLYLSDTYNFNYLLIGCWKETACCDLYE